MPAGHDGGGLGLLGVSGDQVVDAETYGRIRADALARVRGTVQADILKEDQAQNTCIFSTEFALRMMGDVQQYFIDQRVRNFYSVSISGYHIAEAGANPVSQLAFTLANGFTIVEYYLSRGMKVDDFAPNLSFFFSNGMDPEYAVIGRVARRIWARAMRDRYGAGPRSQMLKYHVQTSGRSLHAREIQFTESHDDCRRCMRSDSATACTRMPTPRRSRRRRGERSRRSETNHHRARDRPNQNQNPCRDRSRSSGSRYLSRRPCTPSSRACGAGRCDGRDGDHVPARKKSEESLITRQETHGACRSSASKLTAEHANSAKTAARN